MCMSQAHIDCGGPLVQGTAELGIAVCSTTSGASMQSVTDLRIRN